MTLTLSLVFRPPASGATRSLIFSAISGIGLGNGYLATMWISMSSGPTTTPETFSLPS